MFSCPPVQVPLYVLRTLASRAKGGKAASRRHPCVVVIDRHGQPLGLCGPHLSGPEVLDQLVYDARALLRSTWRRHPRVYNHPPTPAPIPHDGPPVVVDELDEARGNVDACGVTAAQLIYKTKQMRTQRTLTQTHPHVSAPCLHNGRR